MYNLDEVESRMTWRILMEKLWEKNAILPLSTMDYIRNEDEPYENTYSSQERWLQRRLLFLEYDRHPVVAQD